VIVVVKKLTVYSVLTCSVFSVVTGALASQESGNPKRIQLTAGGPAVVLEGQVKKNKDVVYIFAGKAGQKFSGRITKKDGNIGFGVTDADGEALPEEEYDFNTSLKGSLTKTGDYKITVATFEPRDSKYSVTVKLN
jgi:hypothetical protein